jgi:hypothetical protein
MLRSLLLIILVLAAAPAWPIAAVGSTTQADWELFWSSDRPVVNRLRSFVTGAKAAFRWRARSYTPPQDLPRARAV